MNTTRRGALAAAAAALTVTGAAAAPAIATRPRVTIWHKLQRRADELSGWRAFRASATGKATRRELTHQLDALTELVADLADALVDAHTTTEVDGGR